MVVEKIYCSLSKQRQIPILTAGISTPWPFRYPQPVKMSICIASSKTIRDWNDLPESLISSSELSDDSVSKFTSLVRARD